MAPLGTIIEDETEFLDDVEAFMKVRGVPFERDAKVAGRPISLHKLFKMVMEKGGYDKLSAERMMWRTVVKPWGFGSAHEAAMTFQLKSCYYKNVAAYEIERFWGEKAPPPEVLEAVTAKGGDLRSRTLDNYPRSKVIPTTEQEASESDNDDGQQTPRQERTDADDQGSASRYPSRLRQQPKPATVYPPDPTPSRTMRFPMMANSPQPSPAPPQPYNNASADPRNPTFSLDRYEPRQPNALSLRPVITPGSNPDLFYQRKAMAEAATLPRSQPQPQDFLRPSINPAIFQGPNIYQRCLYGLRSGIKDEQDFALHHLVKVSYERGDKYKFEQFALLAEALIEKALEITNLAFGITWQISYVDEEGKSPPNTLNAVYGTPGLIETMQSFEPVLEETEIEPAGYQQRLEKLNEAALVIRNMVNLEENAIFISKFALFRDFLAIALNLPGHARFAEFRQCALDMAEQVTRYWEMQSNDPLYISLVKELESYDRGKIIPALRAINRVDIESDRVHNLSGIPISTIERLVSFVLLDDDELVEATIDFLYEFTAIPENMTTLSNLNPDLLPSITPRLTKLLLHRANPHEETILNRAQQQRPTIPATIPVIPNDLYSQLLQFHEPERSSRWLRCCFEESPQDDITQIAIWQAYSGRFSANNPIPAADFIKNVSNTFSSAQAQVINAPTPKFIIKGIRPRRMLVDSRNQLYYKCLWEVTPPSQPLGSHQSNQPQQVPPRSQTCGSWHSSRLHLWHHVVGEHLGIPRTSEGKFSNADHAHRPAGGYNCRWISCIRSTPFNKASEIAVHVRAHLPETAEKMKDIVYELAGVMQKKDDSERVTKHTFYGTAIDEKGHPCGIPFMSLMLMRNMARYVGRFFPNSGSGSGKGESQKEQQRIQLMGRFFGSVKAELWYVASVHRTLAGLVGDLIALIEKGEKVAKKRKIEGDEDHEMEIESTRISNADGSFPTGSTTSNVVERVGSDVMMS